MNQLERRKVRLKIIQSTKIKNDNDFHNYIGIRSLREGNFEDGWKFYENRGSKITGYLKSINEWKGEDISNKNIPNIFDIVSLSIDLSIEKTFLFLPFT